MKNCPLTFSKASTMWSLVLGSSEALTVTIDVIQMFFLMKYNNKTYQFLVFQLFLVQSDDSWIDVI